MFSSSIATSSVSAIPRLTQTDFQSISALAISAKQTSLIFWSNVRWFCGGMVDSIWSREAFGIGSILYWAIPFTSYTHAHHVPHAELVELRLRRHGVLCVYRGSAMSFVLLLSMQLTVFYISGLRLLSGLQVLDPTSVAMASGMSVTCQKGRLTMRKPVMDRPTYLHTYIQAQPQTINESYQSSCSN